MAVPKPSLHGRDHRAGGSDPIPGMTDSVGIQFDVNNVGSWLDIETTGTNAGKGIRLLADAGTFELTAAAVSMLFSAPDFLFTGISDGVNPSTSQDFAVNVGGDVILNSGSSSSLELQPAGNTTVTNNGGHIQLYANGDVAIRGFKAGGGLQDILRVTQDSTAVADPTYHILTGATWVADL